MYIVIIGCGRLGGLLAQELSSEGHDIAIIDNNKESLRRLGTGFNGHRINGVEFDHDILVDGGIESADVFLAMTQDDNTNIMASQVAKEIFKVPRVIARTYDIERENIYKKLGIETINPTSLGVDLIKSRIIEKGTDILAVLDTHVEIAEIPVLHVATTISLSELEAEYECSICSVLRDGKFMIPSKDEELRAGDRIVCAISTENRERLVLEIGRGD